MAIRSKKNLYPGINPHLNSVLLEREGGWKGFHSNHLQHIANRLESLLASSKYYIADEESLQIGKEDEITIADILISREPKGTAPIPSEATLTAPKFTLPIAETIELKEDDYLNSLVIYKQDENRPITRIELLSPSNKPPGSHYKAYISKRTSTLMDGLRLVEIDYIHDRRPILDEIPNYSNRINHADPYYILISDPRPDIQRGYTRVYGFGVMDALPIIPIPLDNEDFVTLDFGELYRYTFESRRHYWDILTDYTEPPLNFSSYTPKDQEKIRAHMAKIATEQT